ncbi:MAG TPA: SDR family NAD(P)-dependent oxidoreductase [Candidatus Paceibacterota bacterium]|nr:SDR family NAD(P)-dependent oxidoreductase [Candidatus Paceibacterota bacterium]
MRQLEGKRAFVTGGGGALGRASSLLFSSEGALVSVVDINAEAADETVRMITELGGKAVSIIADVSDEVQVRRAVGEAVDAFGGLDTLFNNAGIMPHQDKSFLDADVDLWHFISNINVHSTMLCSKYAVPHIAAAGGGAVVNMSSFLAVIGCTYPQDAYAASKGAISSLTRSMAVQLGFQHIRVNALAPGPIITAHVEQFFPDAEARRIRLERVPLGRFGVPEDAARLACFLASDAASWITGQVVVLDGGISSNYL